MLYSCKKKPFFLSGDPGAIYCILTSDSEAENNGKTILILPPFAEEMNKSRRMLSQQANLLAAQGYTVLQFDLYGTGDSDGDFAEVTWDIWRENIARIIAWLNSQRVTQLIVLALRMGALLLDFLKQNTEVNIECILLWQPVTNGELLMNQFYRLKLASDMMGDPASRVSLKDIKADLAANKPVEIAGYMLNPEFSLALSTQKLDSFFVEDCPRIEWFELIASAERSILPASQRVIDKGREKGCAINVHCIVGAQFWTTAELTDVKALHDKTLASI